jgi:hypothetical protein
VLRGAVTGPGVLRRAVGGPPLVFTARRGIAGVRYGACVYGVVCGGWLSLPSQRGKHVTAPPGDPSVARFRAREAA